MSQEVDSGAGTLVNAQYGLSGVDAEQQTILDDGNISQIIDYARSSRRALTPFLDGVFNILFENVHPIAGELESFVDPYNSVNVSNNFPLRIDPKKFDIYLLAATCQVTVGANMAAAFVGFNTQGIMQGPSDTAAGGGVTLGNRRTIIQRWSNFGVGFLGVEFGRDDQSAFEIRLARRAVPGEAILFRSIATAAVTALMIVTAFIGPVGLGQDLY